eukprot:Nk52_evm13s2340 gene=Nk52_evmTU13s2340
MKVGGNDLARKFLQGYEDYRAVEHDITRKYDTHAAQQYREKITAMAEGRPWTPSAPSKSFAKKQMGDLRSTSSSPGGSGGFARSGSRGGMGSGARSSAFGNGSGAGGYQDMSAYQKSAAGKEDFFAKKQFENANRSRDLPPSQGGQYYGFGSSPNPPPQNDDYMDTAMTSLMSGWSMLSTKAKEAASVAAQKAVELKNSTAEAVNDPNFLENVKSSVKDVSSKATAAAGKGWNSVNSMLNPDGTQKYEDMDGGQAQTGNYGGFNRFGREDGPSNNSGGFGGFSDNSFQSKESGKSFGGAKSKASAPADDWGAAHDSDDDGGWGSFAAPKSKSKPVKKVAGSKNKKNDFDNDGWGSSSSSRSTKNATKADDDDGWGTASPKPKSKNVKGDAEDDDGWAPVKSSPKTSAKSFDRSVSNSSKTSQNSAISQKKRLAATTAPKVCNVDDDDGWGNDFGSDSDGDGWVSSPVTSGRNTPKRS